MTPAAGGTRYDHASITRTALRLLDELGLPDLSMRRIATELGIQPSALYWHFDSKQALLAAVAEQILAGLSPTRPSSGDPVLETARSLRDALLTYRDGAEVVMSSYALGLSGDTAQTLLEGALRRSGRDGAHSASVLLQFILGHALLVQQRQHASAHGAAHHSEDDPTAELEATFDVGVSALLNGIDVSEPRRHPAK